MNRSPDDQLRELTRRLQELEGELARVRGGTLPSAGARGRRSPAAWLAVPLIFAGVLMLSAQTPATAAADVERRLRALEGLVRRGPGNTTQISGPLSVVGGGGKVILHVGDNRLTGAAVSISRLHGRPGGAIAVHNDGGRVVAVMGTNPDGLGQLSVLNASQTPRVTLFGGGGVVLYNDEGEQLAGLTTGGDGRGRIAIWNGGKVIAQLAGAREGHGVLAAASANGVDRASITGNGEIVVKDEKGDDLAALTSPNGRGLVSVWNAGRPVAELRSDGGAGALRVWNQSGKPVAGVLGNVRGAGAVLVANANGQTLAEMSMNVDGRGLFQVMGRSGRPVAVLTRSAETAGGLLQISGGNGPVANVTVGKTGGGYLQLTDAGGVPTVEAGTLPTGLGTVRVGPHYKCLPVQAASPVISIGFLDCIVGGK